jgi:hypothetical protein
MKLCICFAVTFLSMVTVTEAADEPVLELSGGYSVLHYSDPAGTFPAGWVGSASVLFTDWFGLTGQVSGNYKTISSAFGETHESGYAYLGGPRVVVSILPTISVFGQVMLGATHTGSATPGFGDRFITHFALEPGGGVDLRISPRWATRLSGSYRGYPLIANSANSIQLMTAIVFRP